MNWRPIPFISYTINHPQGSENYEVFKKSTLVDKLFFTKNI